MRIMSAEYYKFIPGTKGYILKNGSYITNKSGLEPDSIIAVNKHSVFISSMPSDEQIYELKKLVSFYSRSYIKLYITDGIDEPYVIKYKRVDEPTFIAQIIKFFNDGIVPEGNDELTEEDVHINEIICYEKVHLNEATERYLFNDAYGLYSCDNPSFDDVIYESFRHYPYDKYQFISESGGVVKRFNNVYKELVDKIYYNYESGETIYTGLVFNGSVKRLNNEPEESFINRCCDRKENHIHINDNKEVIDNGWHEIVVKMFTDRNRDRASTGRLLLNAYNDPENELTKPFIIQLLENDNIIIFINRVFVKKDRRLIASELQHELVHSTDNYSSLKFHLHTLKAKIANVNDDFNIFTRYRSLYHEVRVICALCANSEHVAYANAGYRYIMETELDEDEIPDIKYLINISSCVTNVDVMKERYDFVNSDDRIRNGYIYGLYDIRKIIKVLLISYYMKKHKQKEWKKFNSQYLDGKFIKSLFDEIREYSEDELNDLNLQELNIDYNEYLKIKEYLAEYLSNNFGEYMNYLKFILVEALRDKGFRKYVDVDGTVMNIRERIQNN